MDDNNQNKKIVGVGMVVMTLMFLGPTFILYLGGNFDFFTSIPIFMYIMFFGAIFSFIKKAKKKNDEKEPISFHKYEDRHCISCHESIDVNSKYCPYCGSEQDEDVVCDYCGQKNNKHDLMCTNCNGLLK